MTEEQFRWWYTFALRMAHRGWPGLPRKSREFVADHVKDFFRRLNDFECQDRPLLPRLRSWDDTDECARCVENRPEAERTRNCYKLNTCHCQTLVCDIVTELEDDWNPFRYVESDRAIEGGAQYRGWENRWGNRIQCCIRAGMDLACEPSAGVLGFDICDLRRMYRGNIPTWINDGHWVNSEGKVDIPDLNQGECAVRIWL